MVTYDVQSLGRAMVDEHRFRNAPPELKDFHTAKLGALRKAFGIDRELRDVGEGRADLTLLLERTVKLLAWSRSPFDGIEGRKALATVNRRRGQAIRTAADKWEDALTALLVDLIREIHAGFSYRTVTGDDLRRHGFDPDAPEPDPWTFVFPW
jgi:hypothetical protein